MFMSRGKHQHQNKILMFTLTRKHQQQIKNFFHHQIHSPVPANIMGSSRKTKITGQGLIKNNGIWKYFQIWCYLKSTPSIESKKTHIRILH